MANEEMTPESAPESAVDQRGQWFVLHTLSGHEKKVYEAVLRQIKLGDEVGVYEAHIPEEKVEDIRMGTKRVTTRKLFPGYILVRMDLYTPDREINERAWNAVRTIQGVLGFLGCRTGNAMPGQVDRPKALTEEEVSYILRPMETPRPKGQFKVGELVRIKDGAFENIEGKIQSIDAERGKLELMVTILGHLTPVELEFWQVEHVV